MTVEQHLVLAGKFRALDAHVDEVADLASGKLTAPALDAILAIKKSVFNARSKAEARMGEEHGDSNLSMSVYFGDGSLARGK